MSEIAANYGRECVGGAVVLLSGGMDSATLLSYVSKRTGAKEIHALSVLYGQKHAREIDMARWQARKLEVADHRVVDMSFYSELTAGMSALTDASVAIPDLDAVPKESLNQPSTYVPNRNMILLSIASAYAEASGCTDVFYGAQAQDRYGYWDCTREFVERINSVLSLNRKAAVCIHAPFVDSTKSDVLRIGLDLDVDFAHTWTCYRGEERPCGTCPSCVERNMAFEAAGMRDPLLDQV